MTSSNGQEFAMDESVLHNYMEFCDWSIRAIQREFPILRSGHETRAVAGSRCGFCRLYALYG